MGLPSGAHAFSLPEGLALCRVARQTSGVLVVIGSLLTNSNEDNSRRLCEGFVPLVVSNCRFSRRPGNGERSHLLAAASASTAGQSES